MSVVDGELQVYGIRNLRFADASILLCVTTGDTMAPFNNAQEELL